MCYTNLIKSGHSMGRITRGNNMERNRVMETIVKHRNIKEEQIKKKHN
jgi:hypothetical protein